MSYICMSFIVHLHNINDKNRQKFLSLIYLILLQWVQLDSVKGCDKIKDAKWTKKLKLGFSCEYKFLGRPYC